MHMLFENKGCFISVAFCLEPYAGEGNSPYPQHLGSPLRSTYVPCKFLGSVTMSQGREENFDFLSRAKTLSISVLCFEDISSNLGLPSGSKISNADRDHFSNSKGIVCLAIPNGPVHPQIICEMIGKIRVHPQQHSTWICAPSSLQVVPV